VVVLLPDGVREELGTLLLPSNVMRPGLQAPEPPPALRGAYAVRLLTLLLLVRTRGLPSQQRTRHTEPHQQQLSSRASSHSSAKACLEN
jgi:hypothetical protein